MGPGDLVQVLPGLGFDGMGLVLDVAPVVFQDPALHGKLEATVLFDRDPPLWVGERRVAQLVTELLEVVSPRSTG